MLERVGRYEILGELGRGGMGVVYRARDPELERNVAIKAMTLPPAGQDSAAQHDRFLREAKTAARLVHPNIAAVYDVLREGDTAYIVMELIRGASLESKLQSGRPCDAELTARVLAEAGDALDFAHRNGVIHRDVKPANLLLDESGRVKVVDFGIARLIDTATASVALTTPGTTVGTLGYMAPEQLCGDPVDGRADQFSLGVVAYQMTTGKKPFEADTWIAISHKILNVEPEPPTKHNADLKEGSAAAITKALSKSPANRYATCADFARAFAGAAAVESSAAPLKPARPAAAIWIGAAGVVVTAALGVMLLTGRGKPEPQPGESKPLTAESTAAVKEPPKAETATKSAAVAPPSDPRKLVAGGIEFEFAEIKAGQFMMGSDHGYTERYERPRHLVRITRDFYLGATEITRAQWRAVMGGPAPPPDEADLPKMDLNYHDAVQFAARLTARGDGYRYRLPTEAEWEYAARAGTREDLYGDLYQIAWFQKGNILGPVKVGSMEPNAWGLHDMMGNAWEWCSDWFGEEYYANAPRNDPQGPPTGKFRILRGGSYDSQAMIMRVNYRAAVEPEQRNEQYGVRIVREPAR